MKNGVRFGIGCLIVILLVAGVVGYKYYSFTQKSNENIKQAEQYVLKVLKTKYNNDFAIKDGHYIHNTGGMSLRFILKMTPVLPFMPGSTV